MPIEGDVEKGPYLGLDWFILNLIVFSAVFIPLERLFALHPRRFISKALFQDLAYYFISSVVPALLLAFPLSVAAAAAPGGTRCARAKNARA